MMLVPRRSNQIWDPFREMEQLQKEIGRLFNSSLSRVPDDEVNALAGQWLPAIDIYDSKDNLVIKADLPGLKKEEIEVSVDNGILVLKGEKKQENEVKERNYYRSERVYGAFYRAITLPTTVDTGKVTAQYSDGVLQLTLPKKEESKPKQIRVDVK